MALTPAGNGVYDGVLNEHWTIGPKVHGGAMLALCANAARMEHDGAAEPIAVSGNFLWAPDPGPMRVVTTVHKRGRRVSLIDVELKQGERTAVRAAVTLGDPEHHVPPLLSVNPVVPLMQPEPPPGLEPIGPGHPMEDIVHLAHGCDIRPSLTTFTPRTDGGPPIIEYWVRPKGVAPDVLFALLCGDVSAPVTFGVNRTRCQPTDGCACCARRCRSGRTGSTRTTSSSTVRATSSCRAVNWRWCPRRNVRARLQCFPAWPESRSSAVEVWVRHCCPVCCGQGGRSRTWWSPRSSPIARNICPRRIRCW